MCDTNVFLTYVVFPCARVATIDVTLNHKTNASVTPLNLSGKVITRCGNTYGRKYPGTVLLLPNDPIKLTF